MWDMRWRCRISFVGTCLSGIVIGGVGCEVVIGWALIIGLGSLLRMGSTRPGLRMILSWRRI